MASTNKQEREINTEPFAVGDPTVVLGVPGVVVEIQPDLVTIVRDEQGDHWCVKGKKPKECEWIQFLGQSRIVNRKLYKRLSAVAPKPRSGGYRRIGKLFGVSRDTARNWVKRGVPADLAPQIAQELGVALASLKIKKARETKENLPSPSRPPSVLDQKSDPRGPFDGAEDFPPDSSEGVFPSHYLEGVPIRAFVEGRIDHF